MALPAIDVFTTASNQAIATYSASWTVNNGAFTVFATGDDVASSAAGDNLAHWNADAFNNNQYGQIVISAAASNDVGAAARCAASAFTGYVFSAGNGASYFSKYVAGTWTALAADGAAVANSDVVRIETNGTTITPLKNGSTTGTPGPVTDTSIASGSAGIYGYGNTSSRGDNWEGGNLAGTQTINANAIASASTVYQPALTFGAITVSSNVIASASVVYQPALTFGAITISLNAIASVEALYQPLISTIPTIVLNTIVSAEQVYQPTLTFGAITISLNAIASAEQVYQPTVTSFLTITPN